MPAGPRPLPPAGVARVALSGTILGHPWINTFWLQITHTGAVTVTDLQDIADFISASWNTDFGAAVSADAILTQVSVAFYPTVGTELVYVGSYSHVGGAPAAVQDAGASWVIDFVISSFYRGGKPRWYLPGVPAASISNGSNISTSGFNVLVGGINIFRNHLNAHTTANVTAMTMGVVRFASGNAWLTPPVFWPYTSVKVGKKYKLGSQRRRILA